MIAIEQSVIDIINGVNRIQKEFEEERALVRLRKELASMTKPAKIRYDLHFRSPHTLLAAALGFNEIQFHFLLEEITKDPKRGQIADKLNEVLDEALLFYPEATVQSNQIHQRSEEAHRATVAAFEKRKKGLTELIESSDRKINEDPTKVYTLEEASKVYREQWNKIADIFSEVFKNSIDLDTLDFATRVMICSVAGHSKYYIIKGNKVVAEPRQPGATGEELRTFNDSHIATICFELSIVYQMEDPNCDKLRAFPRVSNKSIHGYRDVKLFD